MGLYINPYKKTADKATSQTSNKHRFKKIRKDIENPIFPRGIYER